MRLFTELKGVLTENFVYQSLIRSFEVSPRYWAEAPYEVDFDDWKKKGGAMRGMFTCGVIDVLMRHDEDMWKKR